MKFQNNRSQLTRSGKRPQDRGMNTYRPRGMARPYRCANCQRRMMCAKVGETYLCRECRGGQGL